MYGHKWVSSYGANVDPDKIWQATLRGVDDNQIKKGFQKLAEKGDAFPPSAPEFRKLCIGETEHFEHLADALPALDALFNLP